MKQPNSYQSRFYETEPDVFEMKESPFFNSTDDCPEDDGDEEYFYVEAFDCMMSLYEEILDAESE